MTQMFDKSLIDKAIARGPIGIVTERKVITEVGPDGIGRGEFLLLSNGKVLLRQWSYDPAHISEKGT